MASGRTLRAGLETLAHAFGDVLYVRVAPGRTDVPCPACGDFAVVRSFPTGPRNIGGNRYFLLCARLGGCLAKEPSKRLFVVAWRPKQGWCGFSTEGLLGLGAKELHLDGPWNPGVLVRRDELAARYEAFKKERDHADAAGP